MKHTPIFCADVGLVGYARTTRRNIERVFGAGESGSGDEVFTWNVGGLESKSAHARNLIGQALGAHVSCA